MARLSRQTAKLLWHATGWTLTAVFCIGLVIRLVVKDHFPFICGIYYAAPPLALAFPAALAAIYWFSQAKRAMAVGLSLAAVACIIWSYQVCWVSNPMVCEPAASEQDSAEQIPTPKDEPCSSHVRLLYWNTANGKLGSAGVINTIAGYDPDVIALVESGLQTRKVRRMWQNAFPDHAMTGGGGGMLIICRGKIRNLRYRRLTKDSLYRTIDADIEVRDNRFKLVLVDIGSDPFRSRKCSMEKLAAKADALDSQPMVMAGDFNLPHDSVYFELFENRLQNAFRTAGNGYAPTWPVPLPLIQIDHAWMNSHVRVKQCVAGWSRYSDHRPLVVDFECLP